MIFFPVRQYVQIRNDNAKGAGFVGFLKQTVEFEKVERSTVTVYAFVVPDKPTFERLDAAAREAGVSLSSIDPLTPEEKFAGEPSAEPK